jgi:hypothetical protein
MERHIHTTRRPNLTDSERRLLAFADASQANPRELSPPSVVENAAYGVAAWSKELVNLLGDFGKATIKGLHDGWTADTRSEAIKNSQMMGISESLKLMPSTMRAALEREFAKGERLSLQQLAPLFQLDMWSVAFETKDVFDDRKTPAVPVNSLAGGPIAIIRSLDGPARREMFYDFFTRLAPPEVGEVRDYQDAETQQAMSAYHTIVDGDTKEKQSEFLFADPSRVSQAQSVMGGVLGRQDRMPTAANNPKAYLVARASLRQHYWIDGVRTFDGERLPVQRAPLERTVPGGREVFAVGAKPRLFDDVAQAIGSGVRGSTTEKLRRALPPSLLKGALAMDVISQPDLAEIEIALGNREADLSRAQLDARTQYSELSGIVKAEKAREGQNFAETFSNLSGFEKMALIAAGVYLASQMPGLTAAGAVLYFGSKFLLKQEDPINNRLAPAAQGITSAFNAGMKYVTGGYIDIDGDKFTSVEAAQRVEVMQRFLSEKTKNDLDSSVTGFSLLGDMNLVQLRGALVLGSDDGSSPLRAALDTRSTSFSFLKSRLREKGLKSTAIQKFFVDGQTDSVADDPTLVRGLGTERVNTNLLDAGNGLMVVYYMVAARKTKNRDMVQRLEKLRADTDGKYESLPLGYVDVDGVLINPRQEFMKLVREGMRDAPNQSLDEFVRGALTQGDLFAPRVDAVPVQNPQFPNQSSGQGGQLPNQASQQGGQQANQPSQQGGTNPNQAGTQPGANPNQASQQGGQQANQPGAQPGANPNQAGTQPGANPNQAGAQPGAIPNQPGTQPGANPNQPGNNPGANPNAPSSGAATQPNTSSSNSGRDSSAPFGGPTSTPSTPGSNPGSNSSAPSGSPASSPSNPSSGPTGSPSSPSNGSSSPSRSGRNPGTPGNSSSPDFGA